MTIFISSKMSGAVKTDVDRRKQISVRGIADGMLCCYFCCSIC